MNGDLKKESGVKWMFIWILLGILATTLLVGLLVVSSFPICSKKDLSETIIHLIETEPFSQNLWETISIAKWMDPQVICRKRHAAEGRDY